MKRLLTFSIILTGITITSCHKNFECVCTDKDGNQSQYTYKKNLKKEAEQKCNDWNVSYGVVGGTCNFQNAD